MNKLISILESRLQRGRQQNLTHHIFSKEEVEEMLEEVQLLQSEVETQREELTCAEETLDALSCQVNLEETHFECIGDFIKAIFHAKDNQKIFVIQKLWVDTMENQEPYGYDNFGLTRDEELLAHLATKFAHEPGWPLYGHKNLYEFKVLKELKKSDFDL